MSPYRSCSAVTTASSTGLGFVRFACPLLTEAQDVAFAVAGSEFLHAVGGLHNRAVHDIRALRMQLVVQRLHVLHPEERVPRAALALIRRDLRGIFHEAEHD